MPILTWFLTNSSTGPGSDLSLTDPGAEAYRSPITGWVVGTGSTNHSPWTNDSENPASSFADTNPPDGSLDSVNGDFWVSPSALSGDFASGNWNIHFGCRANTSGGVQDGRMRCRLLRGPNRDGSGAVEITLAPQQGNLIANVATGATQVSTATFDPGAFSLNNEFLFVQIAWERTGAGGMGNADINARIGGSSSCRVITSDFDAVIRVEPTFQLHESGGWIGGGYE